MHLLQRLRVAQKVLGLVGPHPHLRVARTAHEPSFRALERQNVVAQERVPQLHQRGGERTLAALVGRQESHCPPVNNRRRRVQRRDAAEALEPVGQDSAKQPNFDGVVVVGIEQMADDLLGREVVVGHPREAHDLDLGELVEHQQIDAVVDLLAAGVSGRVLLPDDVDGWLADLTETQVRHAATGREPIGEGKAARQGEAVEPVQFERRLVCREIHARHPASQSSRRKAAKSRRSTSGVTS